MKPYALLLFLTPVAAIAQDRVIGLLEIPALHSGLNAGLRDVTIGPVALFEEPRQEAEVAVVVRNRTQLASHEHGYGQVSAAVYGVQGDSSGFSWYRLRFVDGERAVFAWLSQADAGEYRDIHTLNQSGLTYLTDEWDGRIFESPGLGSASRSFEDLGNRPDVRVVTLWREASEFWYLVVLGRGSCSGEPLQVVATGWVPAYSEAGGNTVWFSSRGC